MLVTNDSQSSQTSLVVVVMAALLALAMTVVEAKKPPHHPHSLSERVRVALKDQQPSPFNPGPNGPMRR